MTWGPELFAGTAPYYARYRRYPDAMYDLLARECRLDGEARLLDLGCGTGTLCIPLSAGVADVLAIDPDAEMLAEARRIASERRARNIAFEPGYAEEFDPARGAFRAVTIGSALHWMDRERVLDVVYQTLEPGGALAVCGAGGKDECFVGPDPRPVYGEVIARFLGPERRAGASTFTHAPEPHQDVIGRSRFGGSETVHVPDDTQQTIDDIVGLLFSTSFANRRLLGDDADAFAQEVRRALAQLEPGGIFHRHIDCEVILARKT